MVESRSGIQPRVATTSVRTHFRRLREVLALGGGCVYDLPIAGCNVLEGLDGCALYIDDYMTIKLDAYIK